MSKSIELKVVMDSMPLAAEGEIVALEVQKMVQKEYAGGPRVIATVLDVKTAPELNNEGDTIGGEGTKPVEDENALAARSTLAPEEAEDVAGQE